MSQTRRLAAILAAEVACRDLPNFETMHRHGEAWLSRKTCQSAESR